MSHQIGVDLPPERGRIELQVQVLKEQPISARHVRRDHGTSIQCHWLVNALSDFADWRCL
jgi:hypothetical protein